MDHRQAIVALRWRLRRAGNIVAIATIAGAITVQAQNSTILYSSGFDDADLSFWTLDGPAGATMAVDPMMGQPPGSIRLTAPPSLGALARTPCFPFSDSTAPLWRLAADIFRPSNPQESWECDLFFRLYAGEECDGGLIFEWSEAVGNPGEWIFRSLELFTLGVEPAPRSISADILVRSPVFSEGTCFFDNIELRGPSEPIPGLGRSGFVGLVLLVAATGAWLLSRQR